MTNQAIKDSLSAANQSVAAGNSEQAHKHVIKAIELGADQRVVDRALSYKAKWAVSRYLEQIEQHLPY